jgi:hypothetical protein
MKKLTLVILSSVFAFQLYAQKPLATFFTSGGEEFFVIMDGKKINSEAQSRIENVPLDNEWAKVKIVFKNEEILPVEKTIQGTDADGRISSVTWEISQNNKGKWVVKPCSWSKLDGTNTAKSNIVEEPVNEVEAQEETITTQTITTTYSEEPNDANVSVNSGVNNVSMSINVDDSGESANMNINMAVPGGTVTQSQSHSQTTYTTITTTTTNENPGYSSSVEKPNPLPGYNGRTGCDYPMTNDRFIQVRESISGKDFEDSKLTVAKQVMKSNCLLVSQVKEIMLLFDFESTRLDFAKDAYAYTYDLDNYYLLNDAFDFESSIDELNDFINR